MKTFFVDPQGNKMTVNDVDKMLDETVKKADAQRDIDDDATAVEIMDALEAAYGEDYIPFMAGILVGTLGYKLEAIDENL